MRSTKAHKILKLKQSDWLENIDFNTDERKNAANNFEKDFFKLMNNSVFSKPMKNLRKRINVRLVNIGCKKYVSKAAFILDILLLFMKSNQF